MNSRRKPVDKSADFEEFIEQTSDYLPPSKSKDEDPKSNKHLTKQKTTKSNKPKKKVYIGDLFEEPATKERIVNTTLQLPESLNERLKQFCNEFNMSKNEVIKTLVEALMEEKGF